MRKHRFYYNHSLNLQQNINLDADLSHHISRVLRLQPQDKIYLFNNSNTEFSATIQQITRHNVIITIDASHVLNHESPLKINLGQVISKAEKMDLIIQKATELGVHSITPLSAEFSLMKHDHERIKNKFIHWQKIAIAACCQCWRNTLPNINPAQTISEWIKNNTDLHRFILSPHNTSTKLRSLSLQSPISILIGPEGGFSEAEVNCALEHGFKPISLGPRILRTETAGPAAIAILQSIGGDL